MIQKKVCMLGAFSVGKTSLVRRFIDSVFSEKYQTTIGVKVDKKEVDLGDAQLKMLIWDLAGEDDFTRLRTSYLNGSGGYILVIDGTRPATYDVAVELLDRLHEQLRDTPVEVALNKCDLTEQWMLGDNQVNALRERGLSVTMTSARTDEAVEMLFHRLGRSMIGP